jgi:L-seryl-tRNA(Ser) seleniumtransferase
VGSGAFFGIGGEPRVEAMVAEGASLVTFSGDKLLGGPQAGMAVGGSYWVSAMRRHPLARALRADKLCLAALEATLTAYLKGTARKDLPTLKMLHAPAEEMKEKADRLAEKIAHAAPELAVDVASSVARSGGGTLPLYEVPSYAVRLESGSATVEAVAEKLRSVDPPVVGRVGEGKLWLDVRTLLDGDEDAILEAVGNLFG